MNYENRKTKQHAKPKWFKNLITLAISFAMVVGIFGGMQMDVCAEGQNYPVIIGDITGTEDLVNKLQGLIGETFTSDDSLTLKYNLPDLQDTYWCIRVPAKGGEGYSEVATRLFSGSTFNFNTISDRGSKWKVSSVTQDSAYARIQFDAVADSSPNPSASPSQTGSVSSSSTPSHECNFQWVTTVDPQPNADGVEEYKCVSCGAVKDSKPIPASMATVKKLYGLVKDAPANGTVTTDFGKLCTISDYLLKKMAERNDVAVTIQFEYKDQKLQITFPAGTDYTPVLTDTDTMYGFYGAAAKLGLTVTGR